jgi:prepilin-type N-terminal cleavage/methylation domain-containing protein
MKKFSKGFTLIELLVVIAIIGILSSVVLASLNTARGKGADAAAKANLANVRSQAEIVYDSVTPNSYATVCTDTTVVRGVTAAASAEGLTWTSTANNAATIGCVSIAGNWTAWVQLVKGQGAGFYFCADSTGNSMTKTVAPTTVAVVASCGTSAGGAW